jgi:EpsI family protein
MRRPDDSRFAVAAIGTIALLIGTLGASRLVAERTFEPLAEPLESISRSIAGFTSLQSSDAPLSAAVLEQLRPTSYLIRRYSNSRVNLDVFIAFYGQQRAGESMHSPKHCFPGAGWEMWGAGRTDLAMAGQAVEINDYLIGKDSERVRMLYWYQSKDRIIASEYQGKILLARDALLHNSTAASIVRITIPEGSGTLELAKRFAGELALEVQRCFRGRE